jgi:tetratricopeptide (TPR) repeat protein
MSDDPTPLPEDGFTDVPPPAPAPPQDGPPPAQEPPKEILRPTAAVLCPVRRGRSGRPRRVAVALTADALWVQDTWQLRHVPLGTLTAIEERRHGKELVVTVGPEAAGERLRLTFGGAEEGRRWHEELQACRDQLPPDPPADGPPVPEGVTLLKQVPGVAQTALGRVEFTAAGSWLADRGLQIAAARRGADAVVGVVRIKCRELGPGARHVAGTAVRVEDAAVRERLRRRWFGEEVAALVRYTLILLAVQAGLILLAGLFCANATGFNPPTGETPLESLKSAGVGLALVYAWPLVLLVLLRVLRWPLLLGSVGLAVLAATLLRGLAVIVGHLLAVQNTGIDPATAKVWYLADPFDWALYLLGLVMAVRAWRLAREAPRILPPAAGTTSDGWRLGLLGLTGAYTVALLGFAGHSRYEMSYEMFRPAPDWRSLVDEAQLAFVEGLDASRRDDHATAERCYRRALQLWEARAGRAGARPDDQFNIGITLYNLALVCHNTGRIDEAEQLYERVVALGDRVDDAPGTDPSFARCVKRSRQVLDDLRDERTERQLRATDKQAIRKNEEAQVKVKKGEAGAEEDFVEAIALWEDALKQAKVPDHVKYCTTRLATAYLMLADVRQQLNKAREAEDALQKAISYGEEAVKSDPDGPAVKHNLEVARRMLDQQREEDLLQALERLVKVGRYADAAELLRKRVEEQEELLRTGQDREATARRLAFRLDRFALFLAHCPDKRVRDTKAAVRRARRATELQPDSVDYWYTLALVQYRNGEWKQSLESLEQLKAKEGEHSASDWFLIAMNRYRRNERKEAREAFQKADDWIEERKRQGEDDAGQRFQNEMMRPKLERQRREAEDLLNGKEPGGQGVG